MSNPLRMGGGILVAALGLVATVLAPAVSAAPSPYVVHEVVRARPGGPGSFEVKISGTTPGRPTAVSFLHLKAVPGGWDPLEYSVVPFGGDGARITTYGTDADPPACPAEAVCATDEPETFTYRRMVFPLAGHRYFVAGPRGGLTVTLGTPYWRLRPATLGFRTVAAGDAAGAATRGQHAERFRSASAPGGRHGSVAYALPPCQPGAGSATLDAGDGAPATAIDCAALIGDYKRTAATQRARTWTLKGDVVGKEASPFRLIVFDFPKR